MKIRFRVWDPRKATMLYPMNDDEADFFDGLIDLDGRSWVDHASGELAEDFERTTMLSTGIKDSAGVEIFEGDIIDYATALMTVEFHGGCFFAVCIGLGGAMPLGSMVSGEIFRIRVIGNIHENPELVKE